MKNKSWLDKYSGGGKYQLQQQKMPAETINWLNKYNLQSELDKKSIDETQDQIKEYSKKYSLSEKEAEKRVSLLNLNNRFPKSEQISQKEEKTFREKITHPLETMSGRQNNFDALVGLPGQIVSAVGATAKNIVTPQTYKDLPGATLAALSGMNNEQVSQKDKDALNRTIPKVIDASIAIPLVGEIPKTARNFLNSYDKTFNPIGRELESIRLEGLDKELSIHEIEKQQMEKIGITSNQRKAYIPYVSDAFSEGFTPYGYDNMFKRLKDIPKNLIKGNTNTKAIKQMEGFSGMKARQDAWNVYLGKPQEYNTFRVAETSPINKVYPNLKNTSIFSLNEEAALNPNIDYKKYTEKINSGISKPNKEILKKYKTQAENLLKEKTVYDTDTQVGVMGGYNKNWKDGLLQYNDMWDLNPKYKLNNLVNKSEKLENILNKNPKLKNWVDQQQLTIKTDDFLGKPFMSHGNIPLPKKDLRRFINTASEYLGEQSTPIDLLENKYQDFYKNINYKSLNLPKTNWLNKYTNE